MSALAALLKLTPAQPVYTQLVRQARRFSINRTVAGVHFPIDASAGQMLGTTLGEYVACASGLNASCIPRGFAPIGLGTDPANDYLGDGPPVPNGGTQGTAITPASLIPTSAFVRRIARLARLEWNV